MRRGKPSDSKSSSSRKSRPWYVAALDSEDDGAGRPFLFCVVHEEGSFSARTAWETREKLSILASKLWSEGKRLQIWATNLEYDLLNLFGPEEIASVTIRWGRSFMVSARWRKVEFRDTVRHVPASVRELGKLVGMPKLERDRSLAYCMRDAAITYRVARELHRIYGLFGIEPKTTLASSAYRIWDRNFFPLVVRPASDETREAAREAYHGGRTEPFFIGSCEGVHAIDAASMFPWAMIQGDFPLPWGSYVRVGRDAELSPFGIYRARVESSLDLPLLPVRTREGTIYPNGRFAGWYVGEELAYFRELGGRVQIIKGFVFAETVRPFDDYVAVMFAGKSSARGPLRLMYKLLLNALYGKFAQRSDRIVSVPLAKFEAMRPRPLNARIWNGLAIYSVEGAPKPWGNVIWSAIVTARARIRLHREMKRLQSRGCRLLYCDTDSVIYQGKPGRYPRKAAKPGDFELRGSFAEMLIVGKKEYGLRTGRKSWDLHAKGVPLPVREEYLRTGRATFKRPIKLREAAARGLRANVWTEHTKNRRVSFDHRGRKRDGSLAPIVIE